MYPNELAIRSCLVLGRVRCSGHALQHTNNAIISSTHPHLIPACTPPPLAPPDGDFIDYNNLLRNGILDAYSGIIQGMGQAKADQYLKAELPDIINFVSSIGAESDPDEDVARSAVNLLGDICSVFLVRGVGALHAEVRSGVSFRCR